MCARDHGSLRSAFHRCARKAEKQSGAISRAQLLACDLPSYALHSRVKRGILLRVLPSTYVFGGTPDCWKQRLWIAHLWAQERGVFSHRSAAALWRFPGFAEGPVEMILRDRKASSRKWLTIYSASTLRSQDVTALGRFPVTTATRTLLDLGRVASEEAVEIALDHALIRGLSDLGRLDEVLRTTGGRGCRGAGVLRRLLKVRGDARPCASPLETKTARFLREFGFPKPERQLEITHQGEFVARVDFAYPDRRMVLEVDSLEWHASRKRWESDRWRLNELSAAGWAPFHIVSSRLKNDRSGLARELWDFYRSRPRFPVT